MRYLISLVELNICQFWSYGIEIGAQLYEREREEFAQQKTIQLEIASVGPEVFWGADPKVLMDFVRSLGSGMNSSKGMGNGTLLSTRLKLSFLLIFIDN